MVKEYIERTELIENLKKFAPEHYADLIHQLIVKQPTADVVEVKHGEWMEHEELFYDGEFHSEYPMKCYKCSECGRVLLNKEPYCNCGAKMDGKDNGQ